VGCGRSSGTGFKGISGIITPRASFAQKSEVKQNLAGKKRWAGRTVEIAGTRICFFCVYRYKNGASMSSPTKPIARVAFQGEHGAFSEAAAIQLLGEWITTVPRTTFESAFRAIPENAADALLAPVENSLAGSVVRV